MMKAKILVGSLIFVSATYGGFEYFRVSPEIPVHGLIASVSSTGLSVKSIEERILEAKTRSENVKGLYMTAVVANDQGRAATYLREQILKLIDDTEVNGLVIDVKETDGAETTENLQPFIERLKEKNIWVIARIATFRDNSEVSEHPDYYFKRADGRVWRDNKGNAWMDPTNPGARQYILDFSKKIIDLGFDELQYDYIRFPSDGDVNSIAHPVYQSATMPKYVALGDFFSFLNQGIKFYKPDIILSADLFGYVAIQQEDLGIGQRLKDVGDNFNYISLMLYPSHFYSGFYVPVDPRRSLPAVSLPYRAASPAGDVSAHPEEVLLRSIYMASDILSGLYNPTATSSEGIIIEANKSNAKIRPWLQDFDLGADTARGITYDAKFVRAEIDAAEKAGASGWLLWSPTNIYQDAALHPE